MSVPVCALLLPGLLPKFLPGRPDGNRVSGDPDLFWHPSWDSRCRDGAGVLGDVPSGDSGGRTRRDRIRDEPEDTSGLVWSGWQTPLGKEGRSGHS